MNESTKLCKHCGTSVPVDSKFCKECGKLLAPQKQIAKASSAEAINKSRTNKIPLAIILVVLVLTSVFALSVLPNPLIRNRPWINIDDVSILTSFADWEHASPAYLLVTTSIHNPTHRTVRMEDIIAYLDANVTVTSFPNSTVLEPLQSTLIDIQILNNGNWTTIPWKPWNHTGTIELLACSPTLIEFEFESPGGSPIGGHLIKDGTFHFTITFTINGSKSTLTDDLTTSFTSTPTVSTITTATTPYKPPNECLLPWV